MEGHCQKGHETWKIGETDGEKLKGFCKMHREMAVEGDNSCKHSDTLLECHH